MIKKFTTGLAAATLMLSSPVLAQDEAATDDMTDAEFAEFASMMGGMFKVEPLTEEQLARLPQATRIVGMMMPEGVMGEMMGDMFNEMLGPIMAMAGGASTSTVTTGLGVTSFDLDLTEEQSEEIAIMFDPAWRERQDRQTAMFPAMMSEMMSAMEPPMRTAMSELYAINFSTAELGEIEAFFATDTGASFARKSFTMASDPRVVAATMEAMPAMMGSITGIEKKMEEATADLGAVRSYDDLTAAQKARITELTGFTSEEIEANLAMADAMEEATDALEEAAEAVEEAAEAVE